MAALSRHPRARETTRQRIRRKFDGFGPFDLSPATSTHHCHRGCDRPHPCRRVDPGAGARTQRQHGLGHHLAGRRSVPPAPERALAGRVDAQPAASARRGERLPDHRPSRAARGPGDGRRVAWRLQVDRRRPALDQHPPARLPAGSPSQPLAARRLWRGRGRGGARGHERAGVLRRSGLQPRRERGERRVRVAVHRQQQP